MGRDFAELKAGDRLEPYHLNQVYRELKRWRKLRGSARVILRGVADGESIPEIDIAFPPLGFVGVANGNITKRSGTTPGTGTVTIKQYDGSVLVDAQVSDLTVYNASSTGMTSGNGIDSGQYVWVQRDAFGTLWVSPLECS